MNSDKYLVINNHNLDVEYFIESDDNWHTLRRSNSKTWSEDVHYEKILSIKDTGEGYKIEWEEKPAKVMDYSAAAELTLLLNFIEKKDKNPLEYQMVNVINLRQLL
jgi:thymidylate synthase